MISLALQFEVSQTLKGLPLCHPKLVKAAIHRDSLIPQELAEERNNHEQKRYLWSAVNAQGLLVESTTIYGEDGPVTYGSMRDHPKNKPNQSRRWRSDEAITNS